MDIGEIRLTPAINNPNEIGIVLNGAPGHKLVSDHSHKLPGAVVLVRPSSNNTKMRIIVEKMPSTEAKDNVRRGKPHAGMARMSEMSL